MNKIDMIKNANPFLNVYKRASLMENYMGSIGNNCQIFHKVSFGSEPYLIFLGNNVKITYGCKFITHDGGMYVLRGIKNGMLGASVYGKIIIGNNTFLGNNTIVLPGVNIGSNCVIGAGSVITKSIPDNSVVAGVPGRIITDINTYKEKMRFHAVYTSKMDEKEKKQYLLKLVETSPNMLLNK